MLCILLGVLEQGLCCLVILLLVGSPRTGTGNRHRHNGASAPLQQQLGRSPGNDIFIKIQVIHIRTFSKLTQLHIGIQRILCICCLHTLAQHDLKDISFMNVLLRPAYLIHKLFFIHGACDAAFSYRISIIGLSRGYPVLQLKNAFYRFLIGCL